MKLIVCCLSTAAALQMHVRPASVQFGVSARSGAPVMDETVMQRALEGTLEEEGAENIWLSELGWASYLDKNADSSYNMNQRPSLADDGYKTPDILSNPLDLISSWVESLVGVAQDPLGKAFPTIQNDPTGARSWPKGATEIEARTIKPKVKDFDPSKRVSGLAGFNDWGAPSLDRKALKED